MITKKMIDEMPSLPQVLVQIIDAIHSDTADFQTIATIIRQDAAITTKLVGVANSSYYGRSGNCSTIEQALMVLGTDTVKTVVITASMKQFFSHFSNDHSQFLRRFWRRSLIAANFAQALATLTNYSSPEEAYLCGLLMDAGQLLLLNQYQEKYLELLNQQLSDQQLLIEEQQQLEQTHNDLASQLIASWQLSSFMTDAALYHHESSQNVRDAHHLVKIINLSSLLSQHDEIDDQVLAAANELFGLNEELTRELRQRIAGDVANMAQGLGIDIHSDEQDQQAHNTLGSRLTELNEVAQINAGLQSPDQALSPLQTISRSLFLTAGIERSLLFTLDEQQQQVSASVSEQPNQADFSIVLEAGRSLITDAILQGSALDNTQHESSSIIDKQICHYCEGDILVCWPLEHANKKLGALVFAVSAEQLQALHQRGNLTSSLRQQFAAKLSEQPAEDASEETANSYQQAINETIHEASNPLSIIRNYLETLHLQLGDQHQANDNIAVIKEEIDRVGNILLRLKNPEGQTTEDQDLDINQLIQNTAQIFKDSICTTKKLSLVLKLDKKLKAIPLNSGHLKQILTNLLKNAAEALPEQGEIIISSEASVSVGKKHYCAITVRDNGNGIPESIQEQLFSPVSSTKGDGHSGLGLSIVKKLVDEMKGSIVCRSSQGGTEFQVLIPKPKTS